MSNPVWIRKYLNDRGYSNSDVGFDPNRNEVTLQGKDFYNSTPSTDNKTYADMGDLDKALSSYTNDQNQQKLKSISDSMIQKAQTEPKPFTPPPTSPTYTPPPAYAGFNPDTSAAYQADLRQAEKNAQTGTNNALVALGSKGIGNSQSAVTAANQINAREFGNVTDNLLPQLEQQDYNRYRDSVGDSQYADQTNYNRGQTDYNNQFNVDKANYGLTQDQMANLNNVANYLSGQGQQEFNNHVTTQQNDLNTKQVNAQLTGTLPDGTPTNAAQQQTLANAWNKIDSLGYVPNDLADVVGIPAGTMTAAAKQAAISNRIAQQNADNSTANSKASIANKDNTDLAAKQQDYMFNIISGIHEFDNPTDATKWLKNPVNAEDIKKNLGQSGYDSLINSLPSYFNTSAVDNTTLRQNAIKLAQSDSTWGQATTAERNQMITDYQNLIAGTTPPMIGPVMTTN